MRKTIDFDAWMESGDQAVEKARFILTHFDVTKLKRRRKSPGKARGRPRRR